MHSVFFVYDMFSLKFGGTSMGNADCIRQVADIIVSHPEQQKAVTVSAMSGVTNILLESAKCAIKENEGCTITLLNSLEDTHLSALSNLVQDQERYKKGEVFITERIKALQEFLEAITIIGELSSRSHDAVISLGEILSAFLLSLHLEDRGIQSKFVNLEHIIISPQKKTNESFFEALTQNFSEKLCPLLESGYIPICTGFFGRIPGGIIKAVGRGYSDFTAALVGKACKAKEIQIWTDVSGILSTDPRIVHTAHVIPHLSFDEATELANFGAKVIHPQTIWPAVKDDILVRIKNTLSPLDNGTAITKTGKISSYVFKSVTGHKGITIINMFSLDIKQSGFMAQVFQVFAQNSISVDIIATSESMISVSVLTGVGKIDDAILELQNFCRVQRCEDRAIVAVVGEEMRGEAGIAGRVLTALGKRDINIKMIAQGATELNITALIEEKDIHKAIKAIHSDFF